MDKHWPQLCDPCRGPLQPNGTRALPDHDNCQPTPWCECWTEVTIEAEESTT